ncbi:MAG: M15 family metallopeptidase [Cyclobacteriaceae bacterium]
MIFGNKSFSNIQTCERDIQTILNQVIKITRVDFGVSHGTRSPEVQFELYKQGRKETSTGWIIEDKSKVVTYCDGYEKKSKHNYEPSKAFDIYAFVNGKATWNKDYLLYLGGLIIGVSELLYEQEKITHKLKWGANWDMDDEIITDQGFMDLPHFELV